MDDDEDTVHLWRWEQALDLGLTIEDAERFALSDGDLGVLRRLVEDAACDPHLAAEIVV